MSFRIVLAARAGEEREREGGRNHVLARSVGRRTRAQNCPLSRLLLAVRRRRNLTADPFSDGPEKMTRFRLLAHALTKRKSCEIIQQNWRRGERCCRPPRDGWPRMGPSSRRRNHVCLPPSFTPEKRGCGCWHLAALERERGRVRGVAEVVVAAEMTRSGLGDLAVAPPPSLSLLFRDVIHCLTAADAGRDGARSARRETTAPIRK